MANYLNTPVADLLKNSSDSPTSELVKKVQNLKHLSKAVLTYLDSSEPQLSKYTRVVNLENNILILASCDLHLNHRLHYLKSDMLTYLRQDPRWRGLIDIKTKVIIELQTTSYNIDYHSNLSASLYKDYPKPTPPSSETASRIISNSGIFKDIKLAKSIEKLFSLFK